MGLDAVELLMAIEDRFLISITDAEAAAAKTVGDLERLVRQKLEPQSAKACLTSFTFYRLRSVLKQQFGVTRAQVRPEASLDGLVPLERRRAAWVRLGNALGWHLPQLRLRAAIVNTLMVSLVLTVLVAVVGGAFGLMSKWAAWALGLATVPAAWLAFKVTAPFAVHLPSRWETVGQATEALLALNFGRIAQERQSWSENEVWAAVRNTVVEQLGVDPTAVTREARFVEELGIG